MARRNCTRKTVVPAFSRLPKKSYRIVILRSPALWDDEEARASS